MDLTEIKRVIDEQGESFANWRNEQSSKLEGLRGEFNQFVLKSQRPPLSGSADGLTGEARKSLDTAYRCWIKGDQSGTDRALGELKSMRVGSDPDGGYLVPTDRGDMLRIMADVSPLVGLTRNIELKQGDALEGVLDREQFESTWAGEEQTRDDTDPSQIGAYRIPLNELYSCPKLSQKFIDCAEIDVVEWATSKIFESFAVAEEAAIISGDGIARPRGFTTLTTAATGDATRDWGTIEHVITGANGSFHTTKADPLIGLASKLKPQYRRNARWLMARGTAALIRQMKESTSDQYIWQPGLQAGQPDMLLGFPVVYSEAMPALATGSLSIALGDFQSAYWTIRRPGMKLLADPFTAKPHVRLYCYARAGGYPVNSEALKLLKFSA